MKNRVSALLDNKNTYKILLLLILIVAAVLRFHRLSFQSLGDDELQTIFEVDPGLTWSQFFTTIKEGDGVHPPLFFIIGRFFSLIFGYNEWTIRALSAIGGIASVWAIFLLGKEIKDKRLGLSAAALMCVNYFNIYYSQEARMYTFLLVFTTLSYLHFFRIYKYRKSLDIFLYIICSAIMIYIQYYGFFVIASQLILILFFLQQEKEKRASLIKIFFLSELAIAITYVPWLSQLLSMVGLHSAWNPAPESDFVITYFHTYFGSYRTYNVIVLVFISLFLLNGIRHIKSFSNLKSNSLFLSFIFVITSVVISLGIPWLRSITSVPMLQPRYTIIILPSIIIAFAYGLDTIPNRIIYLLCLAITLFLPLKNLLYYKDYYHEIIKTQLRELSQYIVSTDRNASIVNSPNMDYYLKLYNFKGKVLSKGTSDDYIDSILKKSGPKYQLDTFWLTGYYGNTFLSHQKQLELDTNYIIVKDSVFHNLSAQLYIAKKNIVKTVDSTYFDTSRLYRDGEKRIMALWSNTNAVLKRVQLLKGKYIICIESKGTKALGVFPHNNIFINGLQIGSFFSTIGNYDNSLYGHHNFPFELKKDTSISIEINMDNDASNKTEDRNTLIRNVHILRP